MNLLECSKGHVTLSWLIEQQKTFNSIKNKIQALVSPDLKNQFNVVGITNNRLIIYVNNSLIGNYLNLRKKAILNATQEWEINDIKIKIRVKQTSHKAEIPTPKLSTAVRNKLLNIAQNTDDKQLKQFLLTIANK